MPENPKRIMEKDPLYKPRNLGWAHHVQIHHNYPTRHRSFDIRIHIKQNKTKQNIFWQNLARSQITYQ